MSASQSLLDDADAIIREYLTWRGFSSTLQSFSSDAKDDSLLGLSSKRLVSKLATEVELLNLEGLFTWWDDAVGPLLGRVEEEVAAVGRSLRDSTYRWYLVCCFKQQKLDAILAFFKDHWNIRIGGTRFRDDWKRQWFTLPYTASPERDRYFAVFFTPEWKASLVASLETFLFSMLSSLPAPKLIALATFKDSMEALKVELQTLKLSARRATDMPVTVADQEIATEPILPQTEESGESPTVDLRKWCGEAVLGRRNGYVSRARFSPSCSMVAACGADATSVIWASKLTGMKSPRLFCNSSASCLDWFDDNFLCVGTLDHSIHLWTPANSAASSVSKVTTLRTPVTLPTILDIAFDPSSPGGSQLAVSAAPAIATLPGELQIWNTSVEKMERTLPVEPVPSRFNCIRFNHNGSMLIGGGFDGMIRVFDTSRSGAIMGWPAFPSTEHAGVGALCLSRSETSVFAVAGDGSHVVEYSLHRVGEALRKWTLATKASKIAHNRKVRLDISCSNSRLAVASGNSATVWNLGASESMEEANIPLGSAVDWDDNVLLCGGFDGVVRTFTFAT